jgi:hypothetical protein
MGDHLVGGAASTRAPRSATVFARVAVADALKKRTYKPRKSASHAKNSAEDAQEPAGDSVHAPVARPAAATHGTDSTAPPVQNQPHSLGIAEPVEDACDRNSVVRATSGEETVRRVSE